jgi:NAD(P)H-dependent FMN reductase
MAATNPKKVALIIASTRAVRVGPSVVDFVHKTLLTSSSTPKPAISILDVATFNLPVFNERIMPSMVPTYGQFEYEHSKNWSAAMASFDSYIFVIPEYNFGLPGGVKNAVDYLYNEWIGKPVFIVSYGIKGGEISGASLKRTLEGMKLRVVETRPMLKFAPGQEEIMMAAGAGKLGQKSSDSWEGEKEVLLKGFGELVELMETPAPEPAKDE